MFGAVGGLVARREEAGIGGDQTRRNAELLLMHIERREQQVGVAGPPVVDLVVVWSKTADDIPREHREILSANF